MTTKQIFYWGNGSWCAEDTLGQMLEDYGDYRGICVVAENAGIAYINAVVDENLVLHGHSHALM